jgi:hypothetical protein
MDRDGKEMSEANLSAVTSEQEPKQDKETLRARWEWVEHRVWTDSMLRSLERGIKEINWEHKIFLCGNSGTLFSLERWPGKENRLNGPADVLPLAETALILR